MEQNLPVLWVINMSVTKIAKNRESLLCRCYQCVVKMILLPFFRHTQHLSSLFTLRWHLSICCIMSFCIEDRSVRVFQISARLEPLLNFQVLSTSVARNYQCKVEQVVRCDSNRKRDTNYVKPIEPGLRFEKVPST